MEEERILYKFFSGHSKNHLYNKSCSTEQLEAWIESFAYCLTVTICNDGIILRVIDGPAWKFRDTNRVISILKTVFKNRE